MKENIWFGYYLEWDGGLSKKTAGLHEGKYGEGFIGEREATIQDRQQYYYYQLINGKLERI